MLKGQVAAAARGAPKDDDVRKLPGDDGAPLAASGLNRHVGFMLRLAMAAVLDDMARALKKFDLRPSQYACLLAVQGEPGLNQQSIGKILSVKHSNLVGIISELEERGLVDRARPNSDRRANIVYLTKSGARLLRDLTPIVDSHHGKLVKAVGRKDLGLLLKSLDRLTRLG